MEAVVGAPSAIYESEAEHFLGSLIDLSPHTIHNYRAQLKAVQERIAVPLEQAWLRHCSLEMTMRYTFMAKSDLVDLAQQKEWR